MKPLLDSARAAADESELNVAVVGRFKAGKSSFLNEFVGRPILPVGVVPVTTVITVLAYASSEFATVRYLDGRAQKIRLDELQDYVSEIRNPQNEKQVAIVEAGLPTLREVKGIRLVDTPGLESVLEHNTAASTKWLPNISLALVAIPVDPPLSRRDVDLIKELEQYTPHVVLLLTKIDLVSEDELLEILGFLETQLRQNLGHRLPIYPVSIRPGYEPLEENLKREVLLKIIREFDAHRSAVVRRKTETLLNECTEFLRLAARSAEALDTEREELRRQVLGEREALEDFKTELKLVMKNLAAGARDDVMAILETHEKDVRRNLESELVLHFDAWATSLWNATVGFDTWIRQQMSAEMQQLSRAHRADFMPRVEKLQILLTRSLQDFRNRLSERALRALGIPLRTTEVEIQVDPPAQPSISIGKIFDTNWEVLSFVVPMTIFRGIVLRHFRRKIAREVYKNLSRLAYQWEQSINAALLAIERQAENRAEQLVATIEALMSRTSEEAPQIHQDLARVAVALRE